VNVTAGAISPHKGEQNKRDITMTMTAPQVTTTRTEVRSIAPERLRVELDGNVVGFIDIVGHVHVALLGNMYPYAVEIAQTLDPDSAANAIVTAAQRS
jgi:hypothetical protein